MYRIQPAHLDRMLTFGFHYANKMLSVYAADDAYRLSLTVTNYNSNIKSGSDQPLAASPSSTTSSLAAAELLLWVN